MASPLFFVWSYSPHFGTCCSIEYLRMVKGVRVMIFSVPKWTGLWGGQQFKNTSLRFILNHLTNYCNSN